MPSDTNDISDSLAAYQLETYFLLASAVLPIVDWIFTLDVEIEYAWKGSWKLGKVLFFLTRYPTFLETALWVYPYVVYSLSAPLCAQLYNVTTVLGILGAMVAEGILLIRVWALWERRLSIGIFLLGISVMDLSLSVTAFTLFEVRHTFPAISTALPLCSYFYEGTSQWGFIPLMVQQTFVFILTAIKGAQHYKLGIYGTSLTNTFYRDGIIYYALLTVPLTTSVAMAFLKYNKSYVIIGFCMQRTLLSVLSARMLLHLRQEADTLRGTLQSMTDIRFAVESSSDSSPIYDSGLVSLFQEPRFHNDGWFGRRNTTSSHRSQ